jgi:membrane associated rhomboid family serine protease
VWAYVYGRQRPVGFGPGVTPAIIKQLLGINVAVFLLQYIFPAIVYYGAVWPSAVWNGYFWQPFTYMFLHSRGDPFHIVFNMFALWMFGSPLALAWGRDRFLRFYLLCGFGAGLLIAIVPYLLHGIGIPARVDIPTLGASGAVYGVLLGYSLMWPNQTIMLIFPPIPIRAIYFIPFIFLWGLLFGPPNVSHVGHLGGVVVGYLLLQRQGLTGSVAWLSLRGLRHRWHRYRMRSRLRAVRREEWQARDSSRRHDDHSVH